MDKELEKKLPYAHIITTLNAEQWVEVKAEAQKSITTCLNSIRPIFINLFDLLYKEKNITAEDFSLKIKQFKYLLKTGRKDGVLIVIQTSPSELQRHMSNTKNRDVHSMLATLVSNSINVF